MIGKKTIFFPDEILFMKQNFKLLSFSKIFNCINNNRTIKLTKHVVRNKMYELGLKFCEKQKSWNEFETIFLLKNYTTLGNKEICRHLNSFKNRTREFNVKNISKKMKLLKIKRNSIQLVKIKENHVKNNIYKHGKTGLAKTYPDGKIVIQHRNGYKYKMIKKGNKMLFLHHIIFQNNGGVVPVGHKIYFKDGNTLNCSFGNLISLQASRVIYRNGLTTKLKHIVQNISNQEILDPFSLKSDHKRY